MNTENANAEAAWEEKELPNYPLAIGYSAVATGPLATMVLLLARPLPQVVS